MFQNARRLLKFAGIKTSFNLSNSQHNNVQKLDQTLIIFILFLFYPFVLKIIKIYLKYIFFILSSLTDFYVNIKIPNTMLCHVNLLSRSRSSIVIYPTAYKHTKKVAKDNSRKKRGSH